MKKFNTLYNEILNDVNTPLPNIFDIHSIDLLKSKYKWFNTYQIISEYVEDQELTPIPKKLFHKICQNIKTKEFQILKYSFNDIASLLDEYNYEFKDNFISNLVNGHLYIISCNQFTDDFMNTNEMMTVYNELLKHFDENECEYILSMIQQSSSGVTSSINRFDPIDHKCVFIFINQNKIFERSWTITLEHELTHFIQRVIGDNTLKRSKTLPGNGIGIYQRHKKFFDKIFNNQISTNILEFVHYIVKNREQDTSIKHILMNFQRFYESQNKERSFQKNDVEIKKANISQRLKWLNNIFKKLANETYFSSDEWLANLKLIKDDWDSLDKFEKRKSDFVYAIIGFLIYEELLKERNVKNKLIDHFQVFKYRDS